MNSIDKKTISELLLIVGGFILAETIVREFVNLANGNLDWWILPAFAIALIISGVEVKNGVTQNFGSIVSWIFIGVSIILIVLMKSGKISNVNFLWITLCLSVILIIISIVSWIFSKGKRK